MLHKITRLFFLLVITAYLSEGCKKESVFSPEPVKPEITIGANDSRLGADNIHLSKDTVYILAINLNRDSGQTLSIDAGTLIKVNDRLSITINPGATIEAQGTATEPIVFTSSALTGEPGLAYDPSVSGNHYWYGLRINGNTLTNPDLGSGVLSYMRIEFAGGDQDFSGLLPSLFFNHVSNETTIDNIQVSYSFTTPSFRFSGGNCNASNLISYASGQYDFYINEGYTGNLQNLLTYRHPYFPYASDLSRLISFASVLIENSETLPAISNLTVLGPATQAGTGIAYFATNYRVAALVTTNGGKFHIRNSIFLGFPKTGWWLDNYETAASIVNGESDFTYSVMQCDDSARAFYLPSGVYPYSASEDFKNYMLQPQFNNQLFLNRDDFMLTDPFNYDTKPNPVPQAGSPLLSGANFDGIFSDPFFKKVEYRGALGADNWMQGWANFLPLQTNYNK